MNKPDESYIHFSIGPLTSVGIFKSNAEVKAELDAERSEARSPDRPRMFDDMPECLNDLEELLHLVRVNEFPTILGNRRYWLSQAMHEVQRLRNLSGDKFRLKTRAPESLNGRPEREKYEYAREMLEMFNNEGRVRVIVPASRLYLCSWWFLLAAVWCIVLASADFREEWIYDLSKWALCGLCVYAGFRYWKAGERRRLVPLGILAVVFNPFAPIRFGDAWKVVDGLASAAFLGAFLWDADWIEKAWKNRKMIGVYAFMGALACFTVFLFVGTYLDAKSGGPERREAERKVLKEKADAVEHEKLMKIVLGDDYQEKMNRKVYEVLETEHPISRMPILPQSEPTFYDPLKIGHSPDSYEKDPNWYPGKN